MIKDLSQRSSKKHPKGATQFPPQSKTGWNLRYSFSATLVVAIFTLIG